VVTRDGRAAASSGTLLILALARQRRSKLLTPDEADLRLLLALATFPADADGLRSVGMEQLAGAAGVPYATARRSRDRLIAEGLVACEAGSGRGVLTKWRFASALKVLSQGGQVSEPERCSPPPRSAKTPKSRPARKRGTHVPPPASEVLAHRDYCRDCGYPLDPVLTAMGVQVHPGCTDPAPGKETP